MTGFKTHATFTARSESLLTNMALSTLAQLKHRQLLYGVSTRLSQENIKDMMYLAGIEQRLQESISSGTDVFTILEQRGLLGQHNYTHLISLLETIGRIDLIKTVCSDHQAPAVIALPPDKFSVAEQLGIMKRAQILQKRELYLRSMQKLDVLYNCTSIQQQVSESHIMHTLSLLKISEADSAFISPLCFNDQVVCDMLSSALLFCKCIPDLFHSFLNGESREFECLVVLCRQHWNEFCVKAPKEYADALKQAHSMEYIRDTLLGQSAMEVYQSLSAVFSELLGSHDVLAAVNASVNESVVNGESCYTIRNYFLLIIKWVILLLQAIEHGHVNGKNLQDTVLMLVPTYRQLIVDNEHKIANFTCQDLLDETIELIPRNTTISQETSQTLVYKCPSSLFSSVCLVLLVHATMSKSPQTESHSIKSVLPTLNKVFIAKKEETTDYCVGLLKKVVSNIKRETLTYKSKCEQVIETMTGGSSQSVDIFRSLFEGSLKL